jgi:hypothetical protein
MMRSVTQPMTHPAETFRPLDWYKHSCGVCRPPMVGCGRRDCVHRGWLRGKGVALTQTNPVTIKIATLPGNSGVTVTHVHLNVDGNVKFGRRDWIPGIRMMRWYRGWD